MAIFHLSIRPISRAKGHGAVAQIAYDTRCKLTDDRTGQKHDWSKHKHDVIQWQILGPTMTPGELADRAEQAERRWDARVGRAMDVALPHELNPTAQWQLLRGFGLQLRDEYGAALCVSLHHPNTKGDPRNSHGHIFMTRRVVDEDGDFPDRKFAVSMIGNLARRSRADSRNVGGALQPRPTKSGTVGGVTRLSLKAQGIGRPATQHLGPKAVAMTSQWLPTAERGNQQGNILPIAPHGGDRTPTSTPQNPCP